MQIEPKPFAVAIPAEIPLAGAPLARVIAQVRFPPILSIGKADSVADFQEALRRFYPYLVREKVRSVELNARQEPHIEESAIWRMADKEESAAWCISLGLDFVALETSSYTSRADFLGRLRFVVCNVEKCFQPMNAKRLGVRYIDQLRGTAVDRIGDLVQPNVLGILQPGGIPTAMLRDATVHHMTQAQLMAEEGVIQGRWGNLPSNTTHDPDVLKPSKEPTWVLDLDMFTPNTIPFRSEDLMVTAESFAKRLYSVFRQMVTDEFLKFYEGKP